MSGGLRCGSCNAVVEPGATHCGHCGSPVGGAPAPAAPSTRAALEKIDAQIRSGTVKPHADLDRVPRPILLYVVGGMFIAIPALMASCVGFGAFKTGIGFLSLFLVLPVIFMVIGIVIVVVAYRKYARRRAAKPQARAARISSRRTEVTETNDSTRTNYHVTLEFADGRRVEHEVEGRFYGTLAEDDIGVAWLRADWLQAFDRRDS